MKNKEKFAWTVVAIAVVYLFLDAKGVHAKELNQLPPITIVGHQYKKVDKKVDQFATRMQTLYQFDKEELKERILSREPIDTVLHLIGKHKSAKTKETPEEIAFRFERRVNNGVKFMIEHKQVLDKAQAEYGVYPETLVGLIGVETNYGTYTGDFNVFDTLITLGFYGNHRDDYFRSELEQYLVTARDLGWDTDTIKGSYAGAIGISQIMPSNIKEYAVNANKDEKLDLFNIDTGILTSAKFLREHGWRKNEPIAILVNKKQGKKTFISHVLGPKLSIWLKKENYYNMMHYNPSDDYVMSIFILSQKIKERYADYVETLNHADELKLPEIELPKDGPAS